MSASEKAKFRTMNMDEIKTMKGNHESEASWQRRKKFLIVCQSRYKKTQLNTLSYCYVNVLLYGCRYSDELMDDLYERACDVANYPWDDQINMSRWNEIFIDKQEDLNFYAPKPREFRKTSRNANKKCRTRMQERSRSVEKEVKCQDKKEKDDRSKIRKKGGETKIFGSDDLTKMEVKWDETNLKDETGDEKEDDTKKMLEEFKPDKKQREDLCKTTDVVEEYQNGKKHQKDKTGKKPQEDETMVNEKGDNKQKEDETDENKIQNQTQNEDEKQIRDERQLGDKTKMGDKKHTIDKTKEIHKNRKYDRDTTEKSKPGDKNQKTDETQAKKERNTVKIKVPSDSQNALSKVRKTKRKTILKQNDQDTGKKGKIKKPKHTNVTSSSKVIVKHNVVSHHKKHKGPMNITKKLVFDTLKAIIGQSKPHEKKGQNLSHDRMEIQKGHKVPYDAIEVKKGKKLSHGSTQVKGQTLIQDSMESGTKSDENEENTHGLTDKQIDAVLRNLTGSPSCEMKLQSSSLETTVGVKSNENVKFNRASLKSADAKPSSRVFTNQTRYSRTNNENAPDKSKTSWNFPTSGHKSVFRQKDRTEKYRKQHPSYWDYGFMDDGTYYQDHMEYPANNHYDRYREYINCCSPLDGAGSPFPSFGGNMWCVPKSTNYYDNVTRFQKRFGLDNRGQTKSPIKSIGNGKFSEHKRVPRQRHNSTGSIVSKGDHDNYNFRMETRQSKASVEIGDQNNNIVTKGSSGDKLFNITRKKSWQNKTLPASADKNNNSKMDSKPKGAKYDLERGSCRRNQLSEKEYEKKTEMLDSILSQIKKT